MAWARSSEVSVKRVRSLLSVVANQSFSMAGAELGLTQPAVSQHVRQLEEQLGVPLLARQGGALQLTAAGAALLPAFRRLVSSHLSILDQTQSLSRGTSHIVRLASPASFAALYVAPAFAKLRPAFPSHVLDISEIDNDEALDLIRSGDVDFGFSGIYVPSPGLSFEPLVTDGARALVSTRNPLARKKALTVDELLSQPVIRFPIGTTSHDWLRELIGEASRETCVVCEVRQLVTGLQMVAQDIGVTLVPTDAARACALPGLKALPLAGRSFRRVTGLVRRQSDHMTSFAAELVAMIRVVAAESRSAVAV